MSDDKKTDSLQPEEIRSTRSPLSAKRRPRTDGAVLSGAKGALSMKKPQAFFEERSLPAIEPTPRRFRYLSRPRALSFCAGAVAALAHSGILLPHNPHSL